MLPTLPERDPYDDRRRYLRPQYYEDAAPALPPLRSTLYRDGDTPPRTAAWPPANQVRDSALGGGGAGRMGPPPPPRYAQSHVQPRMDLFSQLPSARVQQIDDEHSTEDDEYNRESHLRQRVGGHPYPQQQHLGSALVDTGGASSAAQKKRSRRMSNSERGKLYRSRRKEYVETLEDQVEALKRQLEEMRVNGGGSGAIQAAGPYDTLALSRDRSRAGFARIVSEYFSLFQFGVPVSGPGFPKSGSPQQQLQLAQSHPNGNFHSSRLMSFLQTLVDPNMRFGENFGVQMLLEQWERYSAYHSSLRFDLNSLEILASEPSPVVAATATLTVRFNRTTIEKVFPHVLWNEALVQRLIGLEVEYPVGNKFYFGPDGKIKRYETEVDFVGAFVKALGSVRDAMQLVGDALIKEQSRIGEDDESLTATAVHSPAGSQDSSSRESSHSHSPIPTQPPSRQRFKQSEARKTEDVFDAYSSREAERFEPSNQGYYHETARPFARAAGEGYYGGPGPRSYDYPREFPPQRPYTQDHSPQSDTRRHEMPRHVRYE